jgi:hypothetical protein
VEVQSLTLSYTPGNMKCDSQASFLACTFASPCLGHKPKVRVVTNALLCIFKNFKSKFKLKISPNGFLV